MLLSQSTLFGFMMPVKVVVICIDLASATPLAYPCLYNGNDNDDVLLLLLLILPWP